MYMYAAFSSCLIRAAIYILRNAFLTYMLHHHMPVLYIYQVEAYNKLMQLVLESVLDACTKPNVTSFIEYSLSTHQTHRHICSFLLVEVTS